MEARVCRARTTPNAKPDTISRGTDRHPIANICLMISENSKGGLKLCPIARNPNRPTSPAASKSLITCAATTARIPGVFVLQASVKALRPHKSIGFVVCQVRQREAGGKLVVLISRSTIAPMQTEISKRQSGCVQIFACYPCRFSRFLNAPVKSFGQWMMKDHSDASDKAEEYCGKPAHQLAGRVRPTAQGSGDATLPALRSPIRPGLYATDGGGAHEGRQQIQRRSG